MPRIPFLLDPLPPDPPLETDVFERLQGHLLRLRELGADPPHGSDRVLVPLSPEENRRLQRRARRFVSAAQKRRDAVRISKDDYRWLATVGEGASAIMPSSEARADEVAAHIHAEMPWMAKATETVWHAMRRSVREGQSALRFAPMLLVGPPGIGKSHFARLLASQLGLPSVQLDAAAERSSFAVAGVQRGWSSAAPGRPMELILREGVINPIIVFDEVEKAGHARSSSGASFDLCSSLLGFLEPSTARRWECPYFRRSFDMSHISWIFTANSVHGIPEPLLSRCPPLTCRGLRPEELRIFAEREGRKRGLSDPARDALAEALSRYETQAGRLSLRVVQRLLDRTSDLEAMPWLQ